MTLPISIPTGQKFFFEAKTVVYRYRAKDEVRSYVFEDEDRLPYTLSPEQVIQARVENRLRDWSAVSVATVRCDRHLHRARVTWSSANDRERFLTERAHEYVMEWVNNPRTPRTDRALQVLCDQVHARRIEQRNERGYEFVEPSGMSGSRLRQLIRAWRKGGEKGDAIVTQRRNRGNYRARLTQTVLDIVWQQTDEVYLKLNGPTVAELHRMIVEKVKEENEKNGAASRLVAPSYDMVARHVQNICAYTKVSCRKGKAVADEQFRLVQGGWLTTHANQVWELDDSRVDLVCLGKDGKTVIGRPWLTVVIDRHTRMIMSFVLSFSPPDTETALEAVRLAMLPKNFFSAAEPGLEKRWPAQGRPDEIHVDNGKAYNSKAFKAAMMRLGIRHETMPLLKAWYKGTVERLIGTIMRQVFHLVAGTTYASVYDRDSGEIAPELVAEATLEAAEIKLLSWLLNQYLGRVHRGIGDTPRKMWELSMGEHSQRMPLTREDIDVATSVAVGRRVRKGGIVVDGLRYLAPHALQVEMMATSSGDREVVVRRDRGDLTTIHFLDARVTDISQESWHPATITPEHMHRVEGLTLAEYRLAKEIRRRDPEYYEVEDPKWISTRALVRKEVQEDSTSDKMTNRVRAEGHREKTLRQSQRRVDRAAQIAQGDAGTDLQADLEATLDPVDEPPVEEPVDLAIDRSMDDFMLEEGLGVRRRGQEG